MALHISLKCVCCCAIAAALIGCSPFAPVETIETDDPEVAPDALVSERCWADVQTTATLVEKDATAQAETIAEPVQTAGADVQIQFETPCPDVLTPDFIAALQRALAARGYFANAVSSQMDAPTRAAIATYQADSGLLSDTLSLETARRLGLVAVERDQDS
ncbi:MAG: peptidoglycan-binding protein [Pseudomonadota bacterium]